MVIVTVVATTQVYPSLLYVEITFRMIQKLQILLGLTTRREVPIQALVLVCSSFRVSMVSFYVLSQLK